MKIIKFDNIVRIKAIELAFQGLSFVKIAERLSIAKGTLSRWRKIDPKFNEILLKAKKEYASNLIDSSIQALATGVKTEEITDSYIIEGKEGEPIKRTVRTIQHKPDAKALSMLSERYDLGYTNKDNEDSESKPIVNLNFSGMTLREVQESLKNSPIELDEDT